MDGWQDGWMDGKLHEKQPWRPLLYVIEDLDFEDLDSVMVAMNNAQQSHVIVDWGGIFWSGKLSQPHFEGSVRSPLTLLKMGLGSPPRLPKTQSSIVGVKTPLLEVFFIPLKRSWSVDV
jgi:hypothetical protein